MPRRVTEAFARLLGLSRDELLRVLPVAATYAGILASMYMLKPARNALFLGRFGADQLPYALLCVALAGGVGASLYARRSREVRVQRLMLRLFPLLGVCLIGFRLLLPHGHAALVYAFYVWVNLFGLVSTSLVWLLANSVFDPREARRVFGFIGAAGIAGATAGGGFTEVAAPLFGTHNLLLACLAVLLCCTILARAARPLSDSRAERNRPRRAAHGALSAVRSSPLLTSMVPLVGLAAVVSVLIDIQFNAVVDESFATTDTKTAFFGRFFAVLNLFAFLFQLLVVPRVLRVAGVGTALFVLPVALALGSATLLIAPVLLSGALAKALDGGLRHSINRSATEILFLPVPANLKHKAKILLDSTIDNLGTGLGALLALLLTAGLSLHYRHLSSVALGATLLWLAAAWRARTAYVDEFRHALSRRRIDPNELGTELSDAGSVSSLIATLQSPNQRQVAYALEMLATVRSPAVTRPMLRLLSHPAAAVRARAVAALRQQSDAAALEAVERLLHDPNEGVRVEVVYYLCTRQRRQDTQRLQQLLGSSDLHVRSAALGCIARYWDKEGTELLSDEFVASVLAQPGAEGVFMRCQLARAMANLPGAQSLNTLRVLSRDDCADVVRAVIEAAGGSRVLDLTPWLITELAHRELRGAATRALAGFGEAIVPALAAALNQADLSTMMRRQVVRVLGRSNSQAAVELLLGEVVAGCEPDRLTLLKGLNKLRASPAGLRFDAAQLRPLLRQEAELCASLRATAHSSSMIAGSKALDLLRRALSEKELESLQRTFRLLGLLYPPLDIYHAYLGVVSGNRVTRANAVEFLDNFVDRATMRQLIPMLEPETAPAAPAPSSGHWLTPLLNNEDPWLRTCAIYASNPDRSPELRPLVEAARNDPNPIVRETAMLVLAQPMTEARLPC